VTAIDHRFARPLITPATSATAIPGIDASTILALAGRTPAKPSPTDYHGPLEDYIMAPFRNPAPTRFSDGTYGVLYGARSDETAAIEVAYHLEVFAREGRMTPQTFRREHLSFALTETLEDLRGGDPRLFTDDYTFPRDEGLRLRGAGAFGLRYPSVRDHKKRLCAGVFVPRIVAEPKHCDAADFTWDGKRIILP